MNKFHISLKQWNKRLSIWQLCRHWWHRDSSSHQPTVPLMTTEDYAYQHQIIFTASMPNVCIIYWYCSALNPCNLFYNTRLALWHVPHRYKVGHDFFLSYFEDKWRILLLLDNELLSNWKSFISVSDRWKSLIETETYIASNCLLPGTLWKFQAWTTRDNPMGASRSSKLEAQNLSMSSSMFRVASCSISINADFKG